ncbi:hypothetical protein ACWDXH_20810 [Micromonospora chokoriensis]
MGMRFGRRAVLLAGDVHLRADEPGRVDRGRRQRAPGAVAVLPAIRKRRAAVFAEGE